MGPPTEGAKAAMEQWHRAGHTLIIFSCNRPQVIRDWMTYYDIPFDSIWGESPNNGQKPVCDHFIDDRAIQFRGDWNEIVRIVG